MSDIIVEASGDEAPVEITPEALKRVRQSNLDRLRALATYQKGIDPRVAQSVLFETFLDTFLTEEDRLVLDFNFESRMSALLKAALGEAGQQKLLEGVPGASNLLLGK